MPMRRKLPMIPGDSKPPRAQNPLTIGQPVAERPAAHVPPGAVLRLGSMNAGHQPAPHGPKRRK